MSGSARTTLRARPGSQASTDGQRGCRIDLWLWRARLARTRTRAAALVEGGAVRLTHRGIQVRLDKPGRLVHVGDRLIFALGGRLYDLTVVALGERRGPAAEARALYAEDGRDTPPG